MGEGKDNRSTDQWHIDKRVSISHLMTTIAAVGVIFVWGSAMETRVALLEQSKTSLEKHLSGMNEKLGTLVADLSFLRGKAEGKDGNGG